jgi:hypothetical protein
LTITTNNSSRNNNQGFGDYQQLEATEASLTLQTPAFNNNKALRTTTKTATAFVGAKPKQPQQQNRVCGGYYCCVRITCRISSKFLHTEISKKFLYKIF